MNATVSPFGQAATTPSSPTSPFGTPAPQQSTNIFATANNQNNTSAGSIFGGAGIQKPQSQAQSPNIFQQNAGQSIFSTPKPAGAAFGSSPFALNANGASGGSMFGSSPFGSSSNDQAASGASIFGGGGASAGGSQFGSPVATNSVFGGASQQNNNSFGSGSFAAGGPSIAQTGFGSPTQPNNMPGMQQQQSGFGSPSFGARATFGNQRSGFGTFANTSFGASSTQGNSLFESLGSANTGMTFGNLAQASPPAQKPQQPFGGSGSFSTWR